MSLYNRDRHAGGFDDFRSANIGGRPTKATDEQLQELVDTIASAAKVSSNDTKKVHGRAVTTKVIVNGSEYNVRLNSDGTFHARRVDGEIEIKLAHNARVWGSPLEFTYTNNSNPQKSGDTMNGRVCDSARDMAREWYKAATKPSSLDI
jgi:hypothetical protein